MSFFECPPAGARGAGRTRRTSARFRTYVLIAIDESADAAGFARPLGTIVARTRTQARAAACALHAEFAPADLRAMAAAGAPAGYLARALARDGERLLGEGRAGERRHEDAA